jgi:hypothetical protein
LATRYGSAWSAAAADWSTSAGRPFYKQATRYLALADDDGDLDAVFTRPHRRDMKQPR